MDANLESLDALEDRWMLGQIPLQDGTLFVRFNQAAESYIGHPELGIKLGFAIPFNEKPRADLPNADENDAIAELEDMIRDAVAAETRGIHVLTLTAADVKELVFYIAEGADIGSLHESLQKRSKTHDVQCMAVRDPDWEALKEFMPQQ